MVFYLLLVTAFNIYLKFTTILTVLLSVDFDFVLRSGDGRVNLMFWAQVRVIDRLLFSRRLTFDSLDGGEFIYQLSDYRILKVFQGS